MLVLQGVQGVKAGLLHLYTLFQQFSRRSPLVWRLWGLPTRRAGKHQAQDLP